MLSALLVEIRQPTDVLFHSPFRRAMSRLQVSKLVSPARAWSSVPFSTRLLPDAPCGYLPCSTTDRVPRAASGVPVPLRGCVWPSRGVLSSASLCSDCEYEIARTRG